jgi:hypothetical protein
LLVAWRSSPFHLHASISAIKSLVVVFPALPVTPPRLRPTAPRQRPACNAAANLRRAKPKPRSRVIHLADPPPRPPRRLRRTSATYARRAEAELRPYNLGRLNPLGLNNTAPALFAYGSEEQRLRYLPQWKPHPCFS